MALEVSAERRGELVVITVRGEVDKANGGRLRERVEAELGSRSPRLIFDLAGMDFIDSSGLRIFIDAAKAARLRGGDCALCALAPTPTRIMKLMGLDRFFVTYPTLDSALAGERANGPAQ
jgi:anti-sigma B factor antagonist